MNVFKKFIPVLIFITITLNFVSAQGRKFVNEYLNLGVGARSLAMMGAVSANTNDITAGYWNPAGLLDVESQFQISAMHSEWNAGIVKYDYIGVGKRFGEENKSFGSVTLLRTGIDNIPNTLNIVTPEGNIDYDKISEFSSANYAAIVSYATKMFGGVDLGANTKILYRQIGSFAHAWGFGFDIGAKFSLDNVRIGLMAKDITSTFTAWSFNFSEKEKQIFAQTGNDIPISSVEYALPRVIAGVAYQNSFSFGRDSSMFTYLLEFDINISGDGQRHALISSNFVNISPAFGVEFGILDKVFLRGGFGNVQRVVNDITGTDDSLEGQPNVGVGLKFGRLRIDYALTNVGNLSSTLYSHVFSLSLDLATKKRYTLGG